MYTKQKNRGTYRSYDPTTGKMAVMNKPTEISYNSTTGETEYVTEEEQPKKNWLAEYWLQRKRREEENRQREDEEKAMRQKALSYDPVTGEKAYQTDSKTTQSSYDPTTGRFSIMAKKVENRPEDIKTRPMQKNSYDPVAKEYSVMLDRSIIPPKERVYDPVAGEYAIMDYRLEKYDSTYREQAQNATPTVDWRAEIARKADADPNRKYSTVTYNKDGSMDIKTTIEAVGYDADPANNEAMKKLKDEALRDYDQEIKYVQAQIDNLSAEADKKRMDTAGIEAEAKKKFEENNSEGSVWDYYPLASAEWEQDVVQPLEDQRMALEKDLAKLEKDRKSKEREVDELSYEVVAEKAPDFERLAQAGMKKEKEIRKYMDKTDEDKMRDVLNSSVLAVNESYRSYLAEDEYKVYCYYLEKDPALAQEYFETLKPRLTQRAATYYADNLDDIENENFENAVLIAMSGTAGLEEAGQDFQDVGNAIIQSEDVTEDSVVQVLRDMIYENQGIKLEYDPTSGVFAEMKDDSNQVAKTFSDVTYGVGKAIPTAAVTAITTAVGMPGWAVTCATTLVSASQTMGGAYREAIEEGNDPSDALAYGMLSASAEAGISIAMQGISTGIEGKVSKVIRSAMQEAGKNKTTQKLLIGLSEKFANAGSAAFEDYLNETMKPIFENVALKENNEVELMSEERLTKLINKQFVKLCWDKLK